MSDEEYFKYLLSCGFDDEEAKIRMEDRKQMQIIYSRKDECPREITSSTYERAMKRTTKRVSDFLGIK
jgi:hypothetical protein